MAGKDYTIGTDITLNDMTDPTKLAQFLAPKLSAANTEYVVTADGDKLHFVATVNFDGIWVSGIDLFQEQEAL